MRAALIRHAGKVLKVCLACCFQGLQCDAVWALGTDLKTAALITHEPCQRQTGRFDVTTWGKKPKTTPQLVDTHR